MAVQDGRWQMTKWDSEDSDFRPHIEQAHVARAEAMTRVGYLAIAAISGVVRVAGIALPRAVRARGRGIEAWRDRRGALREILLFDDRMLRDIGLTRADAWAAVEGALGKDVHDGAAVEPVGYRDIALDEYVLGACNDNGERRRVA